MSQEVEQLYSMADISRHFALPESTCRYYCKRFAAYVDCVGEGRRRRYRKSTFDVIAVILDEMKKSRTATAVEETLAERFPRSDLALHEDCTPMQQSTRIEKSVCGQTSTGGGFSLPPLALSLMERQTVALEGIANMLNVLTSHLCSSLPIGSPDKSYAALEKEVSRLALLLNESEKTQQADIEQLRTWLGRVIRRQSSQMA